MGYTNSLINLRLISEGLGRDLRRYLPIMCGDAYLIQNY